MTDKKATAYSISSQSLGVLTTLLKESFSQILEGGNSSSKPYKAREHTAQLRTYIHPRRILHTLMCLWMRA